MLIGYFGDGPWSHQALKRIITGSKNKVAFVCARHKNPDKELKSIAATFQIPFFSVPDINSNNSFDRLNNFGCDIFVSMSFNQIFQSKIIKLPRLGIINCHAGKLPFYRGRNVINWALINDEKAIGITVHYVDENIDTGDIILQSMLEIDDSDNYYTLLYRSYDACADLLFDAIDQINKKTINRTSQKDIDAAGSYFRKRQVGDENINWAQNSRDVFNFVRALCPPGPIARTKLNKKQIFIIETEELKKHKQGIDFGKPGEILASEEGYFIVKTSDSSIKVTQWFPTVHPKVRDTML